MDKECGALLLPRGEPPSSEKNTFSLLGTVFHERLRTPVQFIRRHIFEMLAEAPAVAEGIAEHRVAFSPELISGWSQRGPASGEGAGEGLIAVFDLDGEHAGGQTTLGEGEGVPWRKLIGDVDVRGADHELGMRHDAGGGGEAIKLHGTEGPGVEVECSGGAFAGEGEGDGGFVGLAHGWYCGGL